MIHVVILINNHSYHKTSNSTIFTDENKKEMKTIKIPSTEPSLGLICNVF